MSDLLLIGDDILPELLPRDDGDALLSTIVSQPVASQVYLVPPDAGTSTFLASDLADGAGLVCELFV